MIVNDPHSFVEPGMPRMTMLHLFLVVSFEHRTMRGTAVIEFDAEGHTVLDTRDLIIEAVEHMDVRADAALSFTLGASDPILGQPLHFNVPPERKVRIHYRTTSASSGIQWLAPELTAGKQFPGMFTQGQAINARSYIPCQDSPGIRFMTHAHIAVANGLTALMGGAHVGTDIGTDGWTTETWHMDHPIPAYLLAIAVGNFDHRDISERIRVWAEPEMLDAAEHEFEGFEETLVAAERTFGPYLWERFDMLIMPPSFPYGGMENPRLTFLSPVLLTGDKSMLFVLAHELGHSWTGNLVTNATWSDFWLNEGWTTYIQWRLREIQEGTDAMQLEIAMEMRELARDMRGWDAKGMPHMNALRAPVPSDMDPDEAVSSVPYVRGALFLLALERAAGRERFDEFVRAYIKAFAFKTVTTDQFLMFARTYLSPELAQIGSEAWVDGRVLPPSTPVIQSTDIDEVEAVLMMKGEVPFESVCRLWHPQQWQIYLEQIDHGTIDVATLQKLDDTFQLSRHPNTDVRAVFLTLVAEAGAYDHFLNQIIGFLNRVGRLKYLRPLYAGLAKHEEGMRIARVCFVRSRDGYHPIARAAIQKMLEGPVPSILD